MPEQIRSIPDIHAGPAGFGSPFDPDDEAGGMVTVTSGLYAEPLPVGQSTVGQVRSRFRDRLDIDPQSVAVLDGRDVDDQTIVRTGQVLMFVRRAGEKGLARARFRRGPAPHPISHLISHLNSHLVEVTGLLSVGQSAGRSVGK